MLKAPPHVGLERLIPLAAQLATTLNLGSDDLPAGDHRIRRALKEYAKALRYPNGSLKDAFRKFDRLIDTTLEGEDLSSDFSGCVQKLKGDLKKRSCIPCKARPKCSAKASTDGPVHSAGNCIAPIKGLYADIEKDLCGLWESVSAGAPRPGLRLATGHIEVADKPAVFKDFSLTGKAKIVDEPSPVTTITVAFYDSLFDWQEFCLLPYLMFHEIVCHGFQDVYAPGQAAIPASDRHPASPNCLWSEGWMDTVAHHLATVWLRQLGHTHHIANDSMKRRAEGSTGDYHNARYGFDGQILSMERHSGRKMFGRVRDSLKTALSEADALELLVRFSLLLNACLIPDILSPDTPNARRQRIARALDETAVAGDPGRLRQTMEDFLQIKDVRRLPP